MNKIKVICCAICIMLLLTGCQLSNKDPLKNANEFDAKIFLNEYKTNQKSAKEKYISNNYLYSGYVDSVEDEYAVIKSESLKFEVYFNDKDLLKLQNDYFIRFTGIFEDVDNYNIIVKKSNYVDDNVDLVGKINWEGKKCFIENDGVSTLLKDAEYVWNGGYCLYNGKTYLNKEYVVVNGKIKAIYDSSLVNYKVKYDIERINSISYVDEEKNLEVKDGIADGTKEAFNKFGIDFDKFNVKYNYISAEFDDNPSPTLDIKVYIKEKMSDEERKKEYEKNVTYLKDISNDGKIYKNNSGNEETSEANYSEAGFVNYFKIGNGIYTVELYNNRGYGAAINSTHYKEYYHLHFYNFKSQ